jgi:hypothetical protein
VPEGVGWRFQAKSGCLWRALRGEGVALLGCGLVMGLGSVSSLSARGRRSYLRTEKTGNGVASLTSMTLTRRGRAALDAYTAALRDLIAGL